MRPPERVKRDLVVQWIKSADSDFAAANRLLSGKDPLVEGAVFHAQQAAEKLLKAALVWHQVEFPKTHDIDRLTDLLETVDAGLAGVVGEASPLTPYAVEARYPRKLPALTLAEAREAVAIAGRVRDAVLAKLAPMLGTDPEWRKKEADE
jgi:HEPN domain-containing protein